MLELSEKVNNFIFLWVKYFINIYFDGSISLDTKIDDFDKGYSDKK